MVKHAICQALKHVFDVVTVHDDKSLTENTMFPCKPVSDKKEKYKMFDMYGTANCLDQLRFFYIHLWWPGECDDENLDSLIMRLEA